MEVGDGEGEGKVGLQFRAGHEQRKLPLCIAAVLREEGRTALLHSLISLEGAHITES